MNFTKKDIWASLILGELLAWLVLPIAKNLSFEVPVFWLWPLFLPVIVLLGMYFLFLVGRKIVLIWQIGKFGSVGILNTMVDWGVLNLLLFLTGVTSGVLYSVFKGISFLVALLNSYGWNKFWTFSEQKQTKKIGREFLQFTVVSVIGFVINVGTASLVVNYLGRPEAISPELWANLGALAGTILGMTWNFLGYKLIVFKK